MTIFTSEQIHALADCCPYDFRIPDDDEAEVVGLGADLQVQTLLSAYVQGIFPWFNEGEPIAWWCPNPRCVMQVGQFVPSKSLRQSAKKYAKQGGQISLNYAFSDVMERCSLPRAYTDETWIHDEMKDSYGALHELGVGFSVEVWAGTAGQSELIGGLYGLKIGNAVFGESMFHQSRDASKLAFWGLNKLCEQAGVGLIDCQLPNDYLLGLGATTVPRAEFLSVLHTATHSPQVQDWAGYRLKLPLSWLYE